jgi:hypothetical protein
VAELLGILTSLQQGHQDELRALKATVFGFRDCSSKFPRRFDPESDGFIAVHQRIIGRVAVGGAAWKLRRLGDKNPVFVAPVDDDFVFVHQLESGLYAVTRTTGEGLPLGMPQTT